MLPSLLFYKWYSFFILATAGALIFPMISIFSSVKSTLKMLITFGILAAIYGISWAMADGNIDAVVYTDFNITATMSQFIGALINVVYILGAMAILAILVSGIYSLLF